MRTGLIFMHLSDSLSLTWLTSSFDHTAKKQRGRQSIIFNKSKIIKLKTPGYKNNISFWRIVDDLVFGLKVMVHLLSNSKKNDVVIVSWPTVFAPLFAYLASIIKRNRLILEVRDLWPEVVLEELDLNSQIAHLLDKIIKFLLKAISKRADKVIVPSLGYKSWMENFTAPEKIIISRFPYVNQKLESSSFELQSLLRAKKDRKLFVFFGMIGRMFDFEVLINLPDHIKDQFYFAVFGEGDNLERYRDLFASSEHVDFFGRINAADIALIAKNADYGFAPYKRKKNFENHFPNKITEYLALSLPIIHTISGEVDHLLTENQVGLYYDGTSKTLVEILDNLNFRDFNKQNCKKLYQSSFTIESVAEDLVESLGLSK